MMQAGRLMVRNESHNKALYIIKKIYIYASKTVNAVAPYLDTHILPNKYNRQEIRRRSLHIAASKCTPPTEPQYCCMTRQTNRLNGYTTQNHVKFIRDTHTHTYTNYAKIYEFKKKVPMPHKLKWFKISKAASHVHDVATKRPHYNVPWAVLRSDFRIDVLQPWWLVHASFPCERRVQNFINVHLAIVLHTCSIRVRWVHHIFFRTCFLCHFKTRSPKIGLNINLHNWKQKFKLPDLVLQTYVLCSKPPKINLGVESNHLEIHHFVW